VKANIYFAVFLVSVTLAASDEFSSHPAAHRLAHSPATPIVKSGKARRYRSVLRAEAREGANFNGHFRVASWGCGTNCIEWAVIDLETGKVWFPSEPAFSCWAPEEQKGDVPDWFEMRITSSLLYIHICDPPLRGSRTFNRRRVYVWRGSGLRLVRDEELVHAEAGGDGGGGLGLNR
jgi:hypothetical protein